MIRPLGRIALRHLARHPWQLGLSVLGIALGVAVALSIDLANESARRAFALSTEAVTGRATHQIVGGPSGVPECALSRAAASTLGARWRRRWSTGDVAALDHPGRTLHLLGIDPFAEAPFRPYLGADDAPGADGARPSRDPLADGGGARHAAGRGALARPTARRPRPRAGRRAERARRRRARTC